MYFIFGITIRGHIEIMVLLVLSFILLLLSLLNSFKILLDGISFYTSSNAFMFNDYWWYLVKAMDFNPQKVGLALIILGFLWLFAVVLYFFKKNAGRVVIMFLSLLTMWTILWGAVLCLAIFLINFFVGVKPIPQHIKELKQRKTSTATDNKSNGLPQVDKDRAQSVNKQTP